jgi:hypothetical protein
VFVQVELTPTVFVLSTLNELTAADVVSHRGTDVPVVLIMAALPAVSVDVTDRALVAPTVLDTESAMPEETEGTTTLFGIESVTAPVLALAAIWFAVPVIDDTPEDNIVPFT